MRRFISYAAGIVALCSLSRPGFAGKGGEEVAKEMDQLRGVWKQPVPKGKGRGGYNTLVFNKDRLLWVITHTIDGEPLSGVSLPCTYRLDPKATPKAMTISRWDLKDLPAKVAIYEVKGDTLRLCVGVGNQRPRSFDEKEGQLLVFTRDKKAKAPELVWEKEKEVPIKPRKQWLGRVGDRKLEAECPKGPITTPDGFEKIWKALRGKEEVPKVDFAKEFVIVRTSSFSTITEIGLILRRGRVYGNLSTETVEGQRIQGFTYGIGVFRRERVDVVGGKIIPKK